MTKIKYNLFALKRQLELKTDRSFTWKEIADAAKAHPNTLQNMAGNKTARIDMGVVAGLIDFFNYNGLPITLSDLFTVTTTDTSLFINSLGVAAQGDPTETKNSL